MLSFIILACHLNVAQPSLESKGCKEFTQTITEENLTPYRCVMAAPPMLAKFAQENPGWMPRRWTCKDLDKRRSKQETNI